MHTYKYLFVTALALGVCTPAFLSSCSGDNQEAPVVSADLLSVGSSIDVSGVGEMGTTFSVESNSTWTVSTSTSWIQITSPQAGQGNGSQDVVFNVEESTLPTSRDGAFTITTSDGIKRTIKVTQRAGNIRLETNMESMYFTYEGGEQTLLVTCNTQWTATSTVSWLTINDEREVTQDGNKSLSIKASPNNGTNSLTGSITLSDVDNINTINLSVEIGGKKPVITVSPANNVPALGGTGTFSVRANFSWSASIIDFSPKGTTTWARFQNGNQMTTGEAGSDEQNVYVTLDANTSEEIRTVTIKAETTSDMGNNDEKTLTITQEAGTRPIVSTPTAITVAHNTATLTFTARTETFAIKECGVYYSEVEANVQNDKQVKAPSVTESESVTLSGLNSNTTYHVCAYATNDVGITVSKVYSFTTAKIPGRDDNETPDVE